MGSIQNLRRSGKTVKIKIRLGLWHMSHHENSDSDNGMKILWGGLILAVASLLILRHDENAHGSRAPSAWPAPTIVNATNSDGVPERDDLELIDSQREIERLRERVRTLETEVATLRREIRGLDR